MPPRDITAEIEPQSFDGSSWTRIALPLPLKVEPIPLMMPLEGYEIPRKHWYNRLLVRLDHLSTLGSETKHRLQFRERHPF